VTGCNVGSVRSLPLEDYPCIARGLGAWQTTSACGCDHKAAQMASCLIHMFSSVTSVCHQAEVMTTIQMGAQPASSWECCARCIQDCREVGGGYTASMYPTCVSARHQEAQTLPLSHASLSACQLTTCVCSRACTAQC
jgi:hypothetical protein